MANPIKTLDLKYRQVQVLRELLIDEMASQIPHLTVDHLILVEHRLQTLMMAGVIDFDDIKKEVKNIRVHI